MALALRLQLSRGTAAPAAAAVRWRRWYGSAWAGEQTARTTDASAARAALVVAAGAAGAAVFVSKPSTSQCYFEEKSDGSVDRLGRWANVSWNIPAGATPGFHKRGVHPILEKYLAKLAQGIDKPEGEPLAVLVPLCGKTVDMPFLCEQGFGVVAVEGVLRAITEFSTEQKMRVKGMRTPTVLSRGHDGSWVEAPDFQPASEFAGARRGYVFKTGAQGLGYYSEKPAVWRGKVNAGRQQMPLHIVQGDMFEVTPELLSAGTFAKDGRCDLVWDRASLVAIPPKAREQYVGVISKLLRPDGRILLVVVDYDQSLVPPDPTGSRRSPPPFSVTEADVRRLFPASSWDIEVLESHSDKGLMSFNQSFKGVHVREVAYLLTRRPDRRDSDGSWLAKNRTAAALVGGALLAGGAAAAALLFGRGSS